MTVLIDLEVMSGVVRFYHDEFRLVSVQFLRHQVAQGVIFFAVDGFAHPFHEFFKLQVRNRQLQMYRWCQCDGIDSPDRLCQSLDLELR